MYEYVYEYGLRDEGMARAVLALVQGGVADTRGPALRGRRVEN